MVGSSPTWVAGKSVSSVEAARIRDRRRCHPEERVQIPRVAGWWTTTPERVGLERGIQPVAVVHPRYNRAWLSRAWVVIVVYHGGILLPSGSNPRPIPIIVGHGENGSIGISVDARWTDAGVGSQGVPAGETPQTRCSNPSSGIRGRGFPGNRRGLSTVASIPIRGDYSDVPGIGGRWSVRLLHRVCVMS